jgi:CheY-like chemotaxis protein
MAGVRVLLVDEDTEVVDVTRQFLERLDPDFDIETATSAAAAVDAVEDGSFDVLVSDYKMPERTGVDLAATVRNRDGDLPCLLYTAANPSAFEDALGESIAGFVQKRTGSEQYDELAERIRDVA